jgi:hypothetical protein
MATFSFGSAPGAPGTYINESVGNVASAGIASFNTVYMLVEAEESVSVATFPFNSPVAVTSLADYRALVGGIVPSSRIPLLSYNCVNAFFQNAQIGDLRVVRVGTPNQIVEIEIVSSGTKINNSGLPSNLEAGDVVYAQLVLNGLKLVAGNGSTGYTSSGEWLGVPVTIPVDYIPGDVVNNRKIAKAISTAIAEAIESNPSVRSSIYVRDYGLVNDVEPTSNSENGFISIAAATYDGTVSVVTQQNPVGSISVLMNNCYDVQNIVGLENSLVRVPQDYIQCINTAFDGQINQGYLVTPTAYAQFDEAGRSAVGAAAAAHCQDNNFKWMALADPGPFLVTDVNKYSDFTPHLPAEDLITGMKYLVDNAIYEWAGVDVTYDKLQYQAIIAGSNPKVAVQQSVEPVAIDEKVGALDPAVFTLASVIGQANLGKFILSSSAIWPADFQIMEVTLSDAGTDFDPLLNGEASAKVYIVAPPFNEGLYGPYPSNGTNQVVYIAETATAASSVYNEVLAAGGTSNMVATPADAFDVGGPTGSTASITYGTPAWDLIDQVEINGQSSNLIQNITGANQYVNTVHLPGTLQDPTKEYRLGFVSRTFYNPSLAITSYALSGSNNCLFACEGHGLKNGQQVFFTQPILRNSTVLFKGTSVNGTNPYFVKVITNDSFLLASSSANYLAANFVKYPGAITTTTPSILYSKVLGGELTALNLAELSTVPMIRGRKYGFASGNIFNNAQASYAEGYILTFKQNAIASLDITSLVAGSGYTDGTYTNVVLNGSIDGTGAKATVVVAGGSVTTVTITTRGHSYAVGETLTTTQLPAGSNFSIDVLKVNGTGCTNGNYTNASLTGGTGSGAKATLVVTSNSVSSVTFTSFGSGYTPGDILTSAAVGGTGFQLIVGDVVDTSGHPEMSIYLNNSAVVLGEEQIFPYGETVNAGWLPKLDLPNYGNANTDVDNYVCAPVVQQRFATDAYMVPSIEAIYGGDYDAAGTTLDTVSLYTQSVGLSAGDSDVDIQNVVDMLDGVYFLATSSGLTPDGNQSVAEGDRMAVVFDGANYNWVVVAPVGAKTIKSLDNGTLVGGSGYSNGTYTSIPLLGSVAGYGALATIVVSGNSVTSVTLTDGGFSYTAGETLTVDDALLGGGTNFSIDVDTVVSGDGDMSAIAHVCYGAQVEMTLTPEQTPPSNLWRFDAITSTEIIDNALRGVGFNGEPQAVFIEAGVDNVNRLFADSQNYFNAFGFIAFYGSYILNASGQYIPPSPYVTGVAIRRYRAEGFQFPPAGVKYQLADAVSTQIAINSAQQNLLNPDGCNAVRTLPGYPDTAVFIWGGRTRINKAVADQRKFQFVNVRVIQNVVYGSLRNAFDNQIFSVIDGFDVIFNQIVSIGNSVLSQLWIAGVLYGARPSDAFQIICDNRINTPDNLENGLIYVKVFDVPVPTLERIEVDLIRVSVGQMSRELESQGLG